MSMIPDTFFRSAENLSDALQSFEEHHLFCTRHNSGVDLIWNLKPKDMFLEIVAVCLGNLYNRLPLPSPLHDRNMLDPILEHLDDEEAGKLVQYSSDWISSEELVKMSEGRRNNYILSGRAVAVLSHGTGHGVVGDLLDRACAAYASGRHTPQIRAGTRVLSTSILSALNR